MDRQATKNSVLWGMVFGFSVILSAAPGTWGQAKAPQKANELAGVKVLKNIEYGKAGDRALLLDLYLPEKSEARLPLIVWIHGGAWQGGSKDNCPAVREGFLQKGYAAASVEYRLTNVAIFPAQIEDCKAAIRWLRANAEKYNLDDRHVGVWGSSAGGHLVALLGTTGDITDFDKGDNLDRSSAVQAVCDFFGPSDFMAFASAEGFAKTRRADSPEAKLLGGPVADNPDKAAKASPTTYASKGDAPFLILHGTKDNVVPFGQSELLYEKLRAVQVEAAFVPVEGAGHGGPEFSSAENKKRIEEFFAKHLKQEKK